MSTTSDRHVTGAAGETDDIDAALSELEKMLNSSSLSSAGPAAATDADDHVDDVDGHAGAHNHAAIDCTEIPRLTGQLGCTRSDSIFIIQVVQKSGTPVLIFNLS